MNMDDDLFFFFGLSFIWSFGLCLVVFGVFFLVFVLFSLMFLFYTGRLGSRIYISASITMYHLVTVQY